MSLQQNRFGEPPPARPNPSVEAPTHLKRWASQSPPSPHTAVSKTIQASLAYFAIVLGTGFVLGVVRVPFLVPRIGERWAELAEMPIMATVIYVAAGYILRRFPEMATPSKSLMAGVLALALSVATELALATVLQDRTLAEFVGSRDKVSGSVYVALLLVFAVMPRIRLSTHVPHASKRSEA
ncbi:MAG: hypothetical protein WBQ57_13140 [Rhodanobacteraceae bacterium]